MGSSSSKKKQLEMQQIVEDSEELLRNEEKTSKDEPEIPKIPWWRKPQPYFIILVTIIDFAMMITEIVVNGGFEPFSKNPLFGPSAQTLQDLGAKNVQLIQDSNQWWRFISPMFLHVGIIHLALNMWFQIGSCMAIERAVGTTRTAIVYLVGGIGGNLASAIFLPHMLSVGASSALFGVIGLILVATFKSWSVNARPCCSLISVLICVALNLIIGLLPFVDNFCHMGGLLTGIFLSCMMLPIITKEERTIEAIRNPDFPNEEIEGTNQTEVVVRNRFLILKNIISMVFGFVGLVLFFAVGFYVFEDKISATGWCHWCSDLSCINFLDWCRQFDPSDANS